MLQAVRAVVKKMLRARENRQLSAKLVRGSAHSDCTSCSVDLPHQKSRVRRKIGPQPTSRLRPATSMARPRWGIEGAHKVRNSAALTSQHKRRRRSMNLSASDADICRHEKNVEPAGSRQRLGWLLKLLSVSLTAIGYVGSYAA
jgi:hypothetical protein